MIAHVILSDSEAGFLHTTPIDDDTLQDIMASGANTTANEHFVEWLDSSRPGLLSYEGGYSFMIRQNDGHVVFTLRHASRPRGRQGQGAQPERHDDQHGEQRFDLRYAANPRVAGRDFVVMQMILGLHNLPPMQSHEEAEQRLADLAQQSGIPLPVVQTAVMRDEALRSQFASLNMEFPEELPSEFGDFNSLLESVTVELRLKRIEENQRRTQEEAKAEQEEAKAEREAANAEREAAKAWREEMKRWLERSNQ